MNVAELQDCYADIVSLILNFDIEVEGLLGELMDCRFLERDAYGRYRKAHAGY